MTHGTLTAYRLHKCRCSECKATANRYQKQLRYDTEAGRKRVVEAAPALEHIRRLLASGVSARAIATAIGYNAPNSVYTLMRRDRMRASTYDRVMKMKIPANAESDSRILDATGTRRRLQALSFMGWSLVEVSRRTGINVGTLCEIRNGVSPTVRQYTHAKVARVFDDLQMTPGTCRRAMTKARTHNWVSPLAWDDIDDKNTKPQGVKK